MGIDLSAGRRVVAGREGYSSLTSVVEKAKWLYCKKSGSQSEYIQPLSRHGLEEITQENPSRPLSLSIKEGTIFDP